MIRRSAKFWSAEWAVVSASSQADDAIATYLEDQAYKMKTAMNEPS